MALKKKKAAVPVPRSYEAADALLREHGEKTRALEKVETRLAEAVARVTTRIHVKAMPLIDRLAEIEAQLEAYADQERARLTDDGKVKFHDMPAGRIGWRANPPSVKWAKGLKADDIVEAIHALCAQLQRRKKYRLFHIAETFLRTKVEPNKDTMLASQKLAKLVEGVRIGSSGEAFYIEPNGAKLPGGEP